MSMPFFGKQFTFRQPDGTELDVRGWGNNERALFETLDGFTLIKDPVTGYYQYAAVNAAGDDLVATGFQAGVVSAETLGLAPNLRPNRATTSRPSSTDSGLPRVKTRWQTRREIERMRQRAAVMGGGVLPAPPGRKTVGDFVGLCILVDFPDVPGTISRQEVEDYCNVQGYSGFGNNGSVYDYFYDNSGGRLKYTNIVTEYYTARYEKSHYTDKNQPYGRRTQQLIREALDHLRTTGFDFTQLTVDNSGYVYATNIFYAGGVDNDWSEGLWPHCSSLPDYELMPGIIAADYQITALGEQLTLGTFCHENGHMICDFPDLYDYGQDDFQSSGVGSFCLMCAGANINEQDPTEVGAYLKFKAGWADSVTAITAGLNATIRSDSNDFFIHRKNEVEYFIIESREKTGRDQALPGSGLAIWHVDELGDNEHQGRAPLLHYECSLVQADGLFDLERGRTPYGEAKDLFHAGGVASFSDSTSPNSRWWSGAPSGLRISEISAAGGSMTFEANV